MNIQLVIQSLVLARGGAERFSRNLIRGLIDRGHAITVYCHEWDSRAEQLGARLVAVPAGRPGRHPWYEFSRNVAAVMTDEPAADVVFGLTQVLPQDVHRLGGGIYSYWYKRKYGRLFPLQLLRPRVRSALRFEQEMYQLRNLRHAIAISAMDRDLLVRHTSLPPERVHLVYNGFDFDEFNPGSRSEARETLCSRFGIDPDKTIVLFAANNYIRKGLPQAIDSLRATASPDAFHLLVIGRAKPSLQLRLKARSGNAFSSLWLDRVDNPADFYRAADIFLFPTQYDSFANVIGEALLCGLPVITTAQAGGAEMIVHDHNGYVVPDYRSIAEMAVCLDLLRDTHRRADFSARASEKISACSLALCAEQTEQILLRANQEK